MWPSYYKQKLVTPTEHTGTFELVPNTTEYRFKEVKLSPNHLVSDEAIDAYKRFSKIVSADTNTGVANMMYAYNFTLVCLGLYITVLVIEMFVESLYTHWKNYNPTYVDLTADQIKTIRIVPFAIEATFTALAIASLLLFTRYYLTRTGEAFISRTSNTPGGWFMRYYIIYIGVAGIGIVTGMRGVATLADNHTPLDCAAKTVVPSKSLVDSVIATAAATGVAAQLPINSGRAAGQLGALGSPSPATNPGQNMSAFRGLLPSLESAVEAHTTSKFTGAPFGD